MFDDGSHAWRARARSAAHAVGRLLPISPKDSSEALHVCRVLHSHGFASTVGHITKRGDDPEQIADEYRAIVEDLGGATKPGQFYLSVKPPGINFELKRAVAVAGPCLESEMGVLFDAHQHRQQGPTIQLLRELVAAVPPPRTGPHRWAYGLALPSRWKRSLDDAAWVAGAGIRPRIVKGEFPADDKSQEVDPRAGFLRLVDVLSGTVPEIAIATHDWHLAEEAITRANRAGVRTELELIFGLPCSDMLELALGMKTPVRFYVPYSDVLLLHGVNHYLKQPSKLLRGHPLELFGRMDKKLGQITRKPVVANPSRRRVDTNKRGPDLGSSGETACSVDVFTDLDGLLSLRGEWEELAPADSVEPWCGFEWASAAAHACSPDDELRVITVRRGDRLVAIAPMVVKRSAQPLRPRRLEFLGGEELREPSRFIASDARSLDLLVDAVVSDRRHPIRFSRLLNENGVVGLVKAKLRASGWVSAQLNMQYPYLELVEVQLKKSLRQDLRRARRKGEGMGSLRFGLVEAGDSEDLGSHLQRAFALEASGWKAEAGTAVISNSARQAFFDHYARAMFDRGLLRLHFLYIDDVAVAFQYGIESAGQFWLLIIGYDEDYRSCSPGNLLLEHSILAAQERGLDRYNLLGKQEAWTQRWTNLTRDSEIVAAFRPHPRSAKALLSDAVYLMGNKELRMIGQRSRLRRGASQRRIGTRRGSRPGFFPPTGPVWRRR